MSWADDEYERETTATVKRMWDEVQEMFYSSPPPTPKGEKKTAQQRAIERECKLWRDNFPSLR